MTEVVFNIGSEVLAEVYLFIIPAEKELVKIFDKEYIVKNVIHRVEVLNSETNQVKEKVYCELNEVG